MYRISTCAFRAVINDATSLGWQTNRLLLLSVWLDNRTHWLCQHWSIKLTVIANIVVTIKPLVASKADAIPPPCHPFNPRIGNSQDCNIYSQPHLCFHHSQVDSGSGSVLVVSIGNYMAYHNLRGVSFHLLGAYEETSNQYFTWLFIAVCTKVGHVWNLIKVASRLVHPISQQPALHFQLF